MKSMMATILIISFIGVAVFGFVTMIFGAGHGMGCIANTVNGSASCPLNSALDFAIFHLDAFKIFSKAVFGAILLILITGMAFSVLPKPLDGRDDDDFVFDIEIFQSFYILKEQLNKWLSLHINSPAFISAAI